MTFHFIFRPSHSLSFESIVVVSITLVINRNKQKEKRIPFLSISKLSHSINNNNNHNHTELKRHCIINSNCKYHTLQVWVCVLLFHLECCFSVLSISLPSASCSISHLIVRFFVLNWYIEPLHCDHYREYGNALARHIFISSTFSTIKVFALFFVCYLTFRCSAFGILVALLRSFQENKYKKRKHHTCCLFDQRVYFHVSK